MKFMHNYARLPKGRNLLIEDINSAAKRLFNKLSVLDITTLDISDYNKRYLGHKLEHLITVLRSYSYILSWSLAKSDVPYDKFVFLDHGGGSGVLSLLAKELGIGTVIYNDIYDVSCNDAEVIANSIGNPADYYICGDIDGVVDFLKANAINCDAIASYDVIEHIYDIESFLNTVPLCSDNSLTVVMSSAANTLNPFCRKKLMRKQLEVEHNEQTKQWGHKERDCLESYLDVRRRIVREYLQSLDKKLNEKQIEKLVLNTRGMIEADIQKCVAEYLTTGKYPPLPDHPTNTCDPYTGNWKEHLMAPYHLARVLSKVGFRSQILSGYYGRSNNFAKRLLGYAFNLFIHAFPNQGVRIAPFYTLYAKRIDNHLFTFSQHKSQQMVKK